MDKVFVDTGAFIALAATNDQHHERARALYHRLVEDKVQLITTNHIVDETCTWLSRVGGLGHPAAVRFGSFIQNVTAPVIFTQVSEALASERRILLVYSSPEIEHEAWRIFERYDTAGFTFTDCTSFALMSMLSITTAFSFDYHYDVMGLIRL